MRDTPSDTVIAIRERAIRLGFDSVGITALRASDHAGFLREWLRRGRHGDMDWLARPDAVEARTDPRSRWPALRSAIVVTMNYGGTVADSRGRTDQARTAPGRTASARAASGRTADRMEGDDTTDASRAIIARYARGRDYHRVMKKKLLLLLREVESIAGHALPAARAYVDTGPVLERELAQRAGLGWFGRNTMLIHPRRGSYSFLAALLTELDIEGDTEHVRDHCGTCNACVEACPTGALLGRDDNGAPVIDATRCISYLTIEHRGAIPRELRPLIGNRVFGCDICQEVCPFNNDRFVQITDERDYRADWREAEDRPDMPGDLPGTESPSLVDLMRMTREEWDRWTRGSAIRRAGYAGLKRNVAVAMGNWLASVDELPDEAVAVLREALEDEEPLVREHAAWALEWTNRNRALGRTDALDGLTSGAHGRE